MTGKKDDETFFVDHMVYVLTAPIVQHPMWPIASRIKDEMMLYRLAEIDTITDKKATGWEVMGYISSQSLMGPLNHEWFKIYMFLFNKYLPQEAKTIGNEEVKLGIQENQMLERIQRWMFKIQMEHIKAKEKDRNIKRQRTLDAVFGE
jgi:hypothetical protein